jgi:hypothetical protein
VKDQFKFLTALLFSSGRVITISNVELRALGVHLDGVIPQVTHGRCSHGVLPHSCLGDIALRISFYGKVFTRVEERVILLTSRHVKVAILNLHILMEACTRSACCKYIVDTRTTI